MHRPFLPLTRLFAVALLPLATGCAHYAPLPLPTSAGLAPDIATLIDTADQGTPLSVDQVMVLALATNPDLKAVRARRGIAEAQLLQSGILPNPSISGALLPLISGAGSVPAWSFGISQDIKALITYRSRKRAAGYGISQVDADILWQEWQTAGQARQLAADLILSQRSRASYAEAYRLLADRNAKVETALAAGNATLITVAPDRIALQAARSALDALDQRILAQRHQLNALLGLTAGADVKLATTIDLPPFDGAAIRAMLTTLADRRPDLLALRMGYAQSDEQVRQAILSQFPDLVLGASIASDNAKVVNGGPNISVGLPIFDRNQGNIAIASATRSQLNAEYAARLAAATGQIDAMLAEIEQMDTQLAIARRDLPAARLAADRASRAFGTGALDERSFVDLIANRFVREQDIMTLELAILDRRIAVLTLIGAGLPTVETLDAAPAGGAAR